MAETKQQEFGVNTNFQAVTPHKAPDFRAENIKSGIGLAEGLGRAEAAQQGRDAARGLDPTSQSLREANKDLDIFEETLDNSITDAQVATGGTLTARQVAEIKDDTLRSANIKARGLQEGIISGQLSHLEATARANLEVQRASNSLIGSLFQRDFQNAFSKTTGSPAGSPAVILNKSKAEIQEEANQKAIVSANAERTKTIHAQMAKDHSTFETAEFKIVAMERAAAADLAAKRLDAENLRSDSEVVATAGTEFTVALSPLMDSITAAQASGNAIDPTEAATLTVQIKNITDTIVNNHIARGLGQKGQKELREVAKAWSENQSQYVEDISAGKITKAQQELLNTATQNLLAAEMPLVYAFSKSGMPELAQSLARMEPDTRRKYVERLGLPVEKMLDLTSEFLSLEKVTNSNTKPNASQAGSLAPLMSMNAGGANKNILDEYAENVGDLSELLPEWLAAPETSLMTVADTLGPHIQANDKNAVRAGVDIINSSRDKYLRLVADYDIPDNFEYTVDKNPGLRNPRINIPDGIPDGEQQIIRQLYRAIAATPALWREDYGSPQLAFEAAMNGHKFSPPDEQIGPSGSIEDFFNNLGQSISKFAGTQASRIRESEGIELTPTQDGNTPERAKRVQAIRDSLIRPADIEGMLNDMAEEDLTALENKLLGGAVIGAGVPIPSTPLEVEKRVQDFENKSKTGWDGSTWKPHESREGGSKTIAYGHKLTDQEVKSNTVKIGDRSIDLDEGITESLAQDLFQQDWDKAGKDAKKIITANNLNSMPAKAKSIIHEMVFQMGGGGVGQFVTTIKFLKAGEFDKAADQMLNSKWAKQDSPERAKVLAEEMRSLS